MKRTLSLFILSIFMLALMPTVALAAKPSGVGGGKPDKGGDGETTSSTVGYDVSWPQCGSSLPTDHAFAIVGVNGGTAANTNECLAEQLVWADSASGSTNQPKLQLYVNTANPGEVIDQIETWPTSSTDVKGNTVTNPYGDTCTGDNDLACSWLYGWDRALEAAQDRFAPAATEAGISSNTSDYIWWLDVETMNTWQVNSPGALERNVATLEGMTSYFESQGAIVGLYSTAFQWSEITGNLITPESNLNGLANWRPSGASLKNAKNNCSVDPLTTGGFISLTQYVKRNLDHNHSCI